MKIFSSEQNSLDWEIARLGIPTSSEFGKLITGSGSKSKQSLSYIKKLVAECIAGKPVSSISTEWTERGHALEQEAADYYALITDNSLHKIGFVLDEELQAGSSPDRSIDKLNHLLEIKCLKAENHVDILLSKNLPLKYVPQVQGQILICQAQQVDVLFYHPDLPHRIFNVKPDDEYLDSLKKILSETIQKRDELITLIEKERENE